MKKEEFIFLNSLYFSIITAHEYTEQAIKRIITVLTIMSALMNKFISEKSALEARPTAWVEISASMMSSHT